MVDVIDVVLLLLLAVTAVGVIRSRSLFAAVMLTGIYSLLSAAIFTTLDAVDVAFTEASVGAGITTVLFLGALSITQRREKKRTTRRGPALGLVAVVLTGSALIYATFDMPYYGDPDAPIHQHVANEYLRESGREIGIPNVVTSVLASYRGYDTLGETTVIFTAALGVMLMLMSARDLTGRDEAPPPPAAEDASGPGGAS